MTKSSLAVLFLTIFSLAAIAEEKPQTATIEIAKTTDSQLSCPQLSEEIADMEKVVTDCVETRKANLAKLSALTKDKLPAVSDAVQTGNPAQVADPMVALFSSMAKSIATMGQEQLQTTLNKAKARKAQLMRLFQSKGCNK